MRKSVIYLAANLAALGLSASAQTATPAKMPVQMPVQGSDWRNVQALAAGSRIRVASDKKTTECTVVSADEQQLACSHGSSQYTFPRAEVKKIKLSKVAASTLGMAAIGAAAGAGAGAGIGWAVNHGDSGSYVHVSGGKASAVGAGVGAIIAAPVAALIGHAKDVFAGPAIYSR